MTQRIDFTDNISDTFIKLADGNPGALVAMMEMSNIAPKVDPDSAFGSFSPILHLDSYGIYGTDIHILYSHICKNNPVKTIAVLRAVQLGLFSATTLADACHRQDRSGRDMVPVDELCNKVKEQLPDFNLE